jgi:hypothetical protein
MSMKLRDVFVRNKRSSVLLERFLIASVTSVVVIRFYLAATGYPQVGGGGLHISHMLWGGLDMLVALVLSLAFLGRRMQSLVALLGGIGFGTFIDELGKFITSDNNYFFQPTIALIYIIFIVLLLSFRLLESPPYVSEQERLANALNMLEEGALHDLREQDKKEILLLLRAHDSQERHVNLLADAVERMPAAPDSPPVLLVRMSRVTRSLCQRLVDSPHFVTITIIIFFIGYALLLMVFGVVNLAVGSVTTGVVQIGWLASSFLSYIMILIGILFLRRSRLVAYIWFKRAILVSIFLTQVFLLYAQPLAALDALLVNLIVLAVLNYLTRSHQRDLQHKLLVQSSTS